MGRKKTMPRLITWLVLCLLLPALAACSNDDNGTDGDATDGDAADGDASDGDANDGDIVDGDASDGDVTDGDATDGDLTEFPIRVPRTASYTCVDEMSTTDFGDADIICRVNNSVLDVELYLQSNPVGCEFGAPIYETVAAWIKEGGAVSSIEGAYDWGGRHHNDYVKWEAGGGKYMLWHSSIGWGYRACAGPDCLLVCAEGTECEPMVSESIAQDGCERDAGSGPPLLTAICVMVLPDGSAPEFLDPWTAQEGHEDYPLLPCGGEENYIE